MDRIPLGTKLVARKDWGYGTVPKGTKGTYTFGSDYVCGWDAGMFTVTLEDGKTCNHWTYEEMMDSWEVAK